MPPQRPHADRPVAGATWCERAIICSVMVGKLWNVRGDGSGETPEIINELWDAHRSEDLARLRKAVQGAYNQGDMTLEQIAGELKCVDVERVRNLMSQQAPPEPPS